MIYIPVNNRALFANNKKADLFISLHVNSAEKESDSTHGIEVLYYDTGRDTQKSPIFINLLKQEFLDRKMDIRQYFMKDQDICVVRDTNMPAVLIEMGFMINQNDRTKLGNSQFMSDMMTSIKNAVDSFFSS